ncbi:MAG: hypothetical protein PV340_03085 [Wolbachia sp.]|nr:hypothetical protein [Wolbachia sp.]MDD9335801.1 hypothetical protein [Wolbachia sp.]
MIGALLWIRNISDYKIKANELELENKKLIQEVESYKNIFDSLPYPILKYNKHRKVKFYNLFYDKHINHSQRLAITNSVYNAKLGKHVTICKNKRRIFNSMKVPVQNSYTIVVYGNDISNAEKLHAELNDYLATQKNYLKDYQLL